MPNAHLVVTDSYDREAFARISRAIPDLERLREQGGRLLPHFGELVEDLFALLFKLAVALRPAAEAPPSTLINRRVLAAATSSPGFLELKEETALDAARAIHGACELARRALSLVKSGELLLEEELLAAQELASEEERLEQAALAGEELAGKTGPLEKQLASAVAQGKRRVEELKEKLTQAVGEMPPRFDAALASLAERLSRELPAFEDSADAFARSVGGGGRRSAAERLELAERLEKSEKLRRLAQLAGAFRADARATRRRRRERAASEVYRVGRGSELARLLPSELAALRHPLRRTDFLRRMVEDQLAQYDLRGDDKRGRGPLVVCIDGSGSMAGERELWAKAVAIALLDVARRQGRRTRALVFSGPETELAQFDLTSRARVTGRRQVDLDAVVGLAEAFPGGGTDFEKPLRAAMEAVTETQLKGADVIFITDGEATISEQAAQEINERKKRRDCSVFAVIVDDPSRNKVADQSFVARAAKELGKVSDRLTTITELTSKAAGDLFRAI